MLLLINSLLFGIPLCTETIGPLHWQSIDMLEQMRWKYDLCRTRGREERAAQHAHPKPPFAVWCEE